MFHFFMYLIVVNHEVVLSYVTLFGRWTGMGFHFNQNPTSAISMAHVLLN